MTDTRTLTVKLAVIRAVQDAAGKAEADTKAALEKAMDPGDRKTAAHQGVDVGTVSYAKTTTTAKVTDPGAFFRWVQASRPTEITTQTAVTVDVDALALVCGVDDDKSLGGQEYRLAHDLLCSQVDEARRAKTVRTSFTDQVLKAAAKDGTAVDHRTGEMIPGVEVTPGGEGKYVSIRQSTEQRQRVLDLYAAGHLDLVELATTPVSIEAGA